MSDTRQQLVEQLFTNSHISYRLTKAKLWECLGDGQLTPAHMQALFKLRDTQPSTSKELAHDLLLTPGALTQVVETLTKLGYVERRPDDRDRRIVHLSISPPGKQKLSELEERLSTIYATLVRDLSLDELQTLVHLQQKILNTIESDTTQSLTTQGKVTT